MVGQPRGVAGRGADACMEADGRVEERMGNIYIKKINMGRLYNYYQ